MTGDDRDLDEEAYNQALLDSHDGEVDLGQVWPDPAESVERLIELHYEAIAELLRVPA